MTETSKEHYQRRTRAYQNLSQTYTKLVHQLLDHITQRLRDAERPTEDLDQIKNALANAEKNLSTASTYLKQTRKNRPQEARRDRPLTPAYMEDLLAVIEANLQQANAHLTLNADALQTLKNEGDQQKNE